MTSVDTVNKRIRALMIEHFPRVRKRSLRNDDQLLQSGFVDSLGILEVVTFLEGEFQITVTDEDLLPENFQSIECIGAFVQSKMKGAAIGQSEG